MRERIALFALLLCFTAGCKRHAFTDFRPLDQAGMWYGSVEQLQGLNTTDAEVAQIVRLKQGGVSDDMCVELVSAAHSQQHSFSSADSAINLSRAGFSDKEILGFARVDNLDSMSGDAVTLRLVGLSSNVVLAILNRQQEGLPTMTGPVIGRLMNTGLAERDILARINQGMTDAQAEKEIAARKRARNQTGFVRNSGRRPR